MRISRSFLFAVRLTAALCLLALPSQLLANSQCLTTCADAFTQCRQNAASTQQMCMQSCVPGPSHDICVKHCNAEQNSALAACQRSDNSCKAACSGKACLATEPEWRIEDRSLNPPASGLTP